jgi:uncharacterized membrane protein YbaN (DUF454 family)
MNFPDVIGERLTITPFLASTNKRFGENAFQRYRKALYTRHQFDLGYDFAGEDDAIALENHILAVQGMANDFGWFFWLTDFPWWWVNMGRSDGATVTWTIPGRSTSSQQFFYGLNVPLTVVSIVAGAGADGRDLVTFDSSPPKGARVWANFVGSRFFRVAFEQDAQPVNRLLDPDGHYSLQTRLVQVK